eukprot:3455282-Amphidinium_carterae.1
MALLSSRLSPPFRYLSMALSSSRLSSPCGIVKLTVVFTISLPLYGILELTVAFWHCRPHGCLHIGILALSNVFADVLGLPGCHCCRWLCQLHACLVSPLSILALSSIWMSALG